MFFLLCGVGRNVSAQNKAEIKFEKTTHNFGQLPSEKPVATCVFVFKNTGDAPLIVNQAMASCGCTVPSFTKKPVAPGDTGSVKITYNGRGVSGHFRKVITVRTNAKETMTRLIIEGDVVKKKEE